MSQPVAELPELIREWRQHTGRTYADLAEQARLSVRLVVRAAQSGNIPKSARQRILTELFRDVLRNSERVDIAW